MILDDRTDCVDCELAWSPDTVNWERIREGHPLIALGPKGSSDWGCIYAAAGPILADDKIPVCYSGGNDTHLSWRRTGLGLARLRPDGFAGFEPVDSSRTGVIMTRPVVCTGGVLPLTADARGGSVRVEVAGLDASTCELIVAHVTDAVVTWNGVQSLDRLRGQAVQLIFHLRAGRLYAFRFSDGRGTRQTHTRKPQPDRAQVVSGSPGPGRRRHGRSGVRPWNPPRSRVTACSRFHSCWRIR